MDRATADQLLKIAAGMIGDGKIALDEARKLRGFTLARREKKAALVERAATLAVCSTSISLFVKVERAKTRASGGV